MSQAVGQPGSRGDGHGADSPGAEPGGVRWLVLVYKVPAEPTRLRAGVWRKIKGLGAIYLQNSVAALPQGPSAERSLRVLRNEIVEMGGSALLLGSEVLAGSAEVEQSFNAARNDEYEEIVDRCQDFLGQIDKEYRAEHFTYAELEENDEDLVKLRNWFAKVENRDVLSAPGKAEATAALAKCEQVLDEYAARVYAEEGEGR
ncbi:Chromate resistance protein ChrB [Streptacidiphilus sp. P02-A3a]|uniref:Chromate resistance protein ChrB n=1 Tax=Streptacidiphilus sp. P02-A3a TaxID=2704468 RepID=UPI001CDCB2E5|nr:Chromate resistance protein ChrB [Streptacidiphilus sp. P02-A3a]